MVEDNPYAPTKAPVALTMSLRWTRDGAMAITAPAAAPTRAAELPPTRFNR